MADDDNTTRGRRGAAGHGEGRKPTINDVARLAGVPKPVLERAKQILSNLEESELTPEGNVRQPRKQQDREKLKSLAPAPQMDLFG